MPSLRRVILRPGVALNDETPSRISRRKVVTRSAGPSDVINACICRASATSRFRRSKYPGVSRTAAATFLGEGAAVLSAENSVENDAERGILAVKLHSDGRHYDALYVDGGVSSSQTAGHLRMQGKEVYRHAVVNLAAVAGEAMEAAGLAPSDIDWLVPHQANLRIMNAIAKRLDLPPEKMVVTVDRHANTSSASIPLALVEAIEDGRIKSGDVVLMEAIGGGFVWGSAVARW